VSDQGHGIPPEDRARATERFFRGESARSTPGSGLGLSLVQAVATLHGGSLRLEDNEPGLRAVIVMPAPSAAIASPRA
jgi:signal transduction histidine kinase